VATLQLSCPVLPTATRLHPNEARRQLRDRVSYPGSRHALLYGDFTLRVDAMQVKDAFGQITPQACDFPTEPSLSRSDAAKLTSEEVSLGGGRSIPLEPVLWGSSKPFGPVRLVARRGRW